MADAGVIIDPILVQRLVEQAVQDNILNAVESLTSDPAWLAKIERMVNQTVLQETITRLSAVDINPAIKQRIDESMKAFQQDILKKFVSTGITDHATVTQIIVTDNTTVVDNGLVTPSIEVTETATVQNLIVKGSINTDNHSWTNLTTQISQKTLDLMTAEWTDGLVQQTAERIQKQGIDFDQITVSGEKLINGNQLARSITETNIQTVGSLRQLIVTGEAHLNNTISVLNKRIGINTQEPEMALSVWDEEVSIVVGKYKAKQAYIGTNRDQGIVIGVNRSPQIEISSEGLTTVKKLQVGLHKISHDNKVPGWTGTRGDIVFNSNPGPDRVFAWVCLGAFKWQTLKSAE